MYKLFFITIVASIAVQIVPACKKSNKPPDPVEEQLRISTNATALNYATGPNTEFNLTVESVMPQLGVKIEFVVMGETDNFHHYVGPPIETTNKSTRILINNLPKQKICICVITVTSKSKPSNSAVTSFRVVFK